MRVLASWWLSVRSCYQLLEVTLISLRLTSPFNMAAHFFKAKKEESKFASTAVSYNVSKEKTAHHLAMLSVRS